MSARKSIYIAADVNSLPVWARQQINALILTNESYERRLKEGPEDSDTFAEPHSSTPRPLGKRTMVRFGGLGYDGTYDVSYHDGELHVLANNHGTTVIMPSASNTFRVGVKD